MKRGVFATALAGIASVAAYGTSLAAPIAPLPVAVTADNRRIISSSAFPTKTHHHTYY